MIQETEIPLLRGKIVAVMRDEQGQRWAKVSIRCPGCRQRHEHGCTLDGDNPVTIHRAAHCGDVPFVESGYYVAVDPADIPGGRNRIEAAACRG